MDTAGNLAPTHITATQQLRYYTEAKNASKNQTHLFDDGTQLFEFNYNQFSNTAGFKAIDPNAFHDSIHVETGKPLTVLPNDIDPNTLYYLPISEFLSWNCTVAVITAGTDKNGAYIDFTVSFDKPFEAPTGKVSGQKVSISLPLNQVVVESDAAPEAVISFKPVPAEKVKYRANYYKSPFYEIRDTNLPAAIRINTILYNLDNSPLASLVRVTDLVSGNVVTPRQMRYDLSPGNTLPMWVQNNGIDFAYQIPSGAYFHAGSDRVRIGSQTTGDTLMYQILPVLNQTGGFLRPATPRADMKYMVYFYDQAGGNFSLNNGKFLVRQYYDEGGKLKAKTLDSVSSYTAYGLTHTVRSGDSLDITAGKTLAKLIASVYDYPKEIRFTDTTALTISNLSPKISQKNVPVNATVSFYLSEPADPKTITYETVRLFNKETGKEIPSKVEYDAKELKVTLFPNSDQSKPVVDSLRKKLDSGTTYEVVVIGIEDMHRNVTKEFKLSFQCEGIKTFVYDYIENENNINIYPNPTSEQTEVQFYLASPSFVNLSITNTIGYKVAKVIDNVYYGQGKSKVAFNTENFSPGVYFCTLKFRCPTSARCWTSTRMAKFVVVR